MSFNLSDLPAGIVLSLIGLIWLLLLNNGIIDFLKDITGKRIRHIRQTSTRIMVAIVGVILLVSGPVYIYYNNSVAPASTCIYSAAAKTDDEAIHWLIEQEARAVVSENMDLIVGIFNDKAKIVDYYDRNSPTVWKNPIDRYQQLFKDYEFTDTQNTNIRSLGAINRDTAYYISGSHGTYFHNGQNQLFQNPDDASHWTLIKINGCWQITKFEFNASGVVFP